MDQLLSFFDQVIFTYGEYSLHVGQIVMVLGLVLVTWVLLRLGKWMIKKRVWVIKKIAKDVQARNKVLAVYRILLISGAVILGLESLGIKVQELLDFTILPLGNEKRISVGNVVFGILMLVLTHYLVTNFKRLFIDREAAKRVTMDPGRRMAIFQIFQYMAYLLAVIVIISSLDVDIKAILVGSAALFVGLGLALQNVFSDILSGILILFDGTIEVGDWLVIKDRNIEGEVKEIRLRTTIIETLESTSLIIPNRMFSDSDILNWSYNDRETRFSINVGVAYGSNLQTVRKVLKSCAENHGRVLKSPEPRVLFTNFGDSSLDFELVYWLATFQDHQIVESDIRFMIDSDFRKYNITIPFPQRDLHIIKDEKQAEEILGEGQEKQKLP